MQILSLATSSLAVLLFFHGLGAAQQSVSRAPAQQSMQPGYVGPKLIPQDTAANDRFGTSCAVSGNTLIVDAYGFGGQQGAVYVFERSSGASPAWKQTKKIFAFDGSSFDQFGRSIRINEAADVIVVGAKGDEPFGARSGSIYIYGRNAGGPGNWGLLKKISAYDGAPHDLFGWAVTISGDTVFVGARWNDDAGYNTGKVYVYERSLGGPDGWGLADEIIASDLDSSESFGYSLAADGDTLVVGAVGERYLGTLYGAAYVYERDPLDANNWIERKKLWPTFGQPNLYGYSFGITTAIDGDRVVIGAPWEIVTVYEDGAVYVFDRDQDGPGNWGKAAKLLADDAVYQNRLGISVAVAGDTVVAGSSRANGMVGTESSDGALYVFKSSATGWYQSNLMLPPGGEPWDTFGLSVATDGTTLVTGSSTEDYACPSDPQCNSGAAAVYQSW